MRSQAAIPEWSKTISKNSKVTLAVIDMQKLFITDLKSPWHDLDMLKIVPNIKALVCAVSPERSLFTQFRPPVDWQDENRSWRTYYYYNRGVTSEILGTEAIEVIDDFLDEVKNPAVSIVSKKTASAFSSPAFVNTLEQSNTLFLIVCGIETDYCVLATALDALNKGYYVIIPIDACASSKKGAGQKNAEGIFERFPEQLWLTDTASLIQQLQA